LGYPQKGAILIKRSNRKIIYRIKILSFKPADPAAFTLGGISVESTAQGNDPCQFINEVPLHVLSRSF
jgi:hypothetical protein